MGCCGFMAVGVDGRFGCVDVLKGLAILMVVWSHTDCFYTDLWGLGNFGNIAFFFLSGFFFKVNAPFGEFLSKRVWRLLVPFFLFYALSILYWVVMDMWDHRSLSLLAFDWRRVLEVFKVEAGIDYLSLNEPLWFLLTLFWVQLFGFFVMRLPKWGVFGVGLAALFFGPELVIWPTPLMFNTACYWFGFFAVGNVLGLPLLSVLSSIRWRLVIFALSAVVAAGVVAFLEWHGAVGYWRLMIAVAYLSADVALLALGGFIENLRVSRWLRFYGVSSLFILGSHLFVLGLVERVSYKVTGVRDPWVGLACVVLTALILVPLIRFAQRRLPMLMGDGRP